MMTDTKITKYDWELINKSNSHGYYIVNDVGETVCDLYFKNELKDNDIVEFTNAKENANLIASAPELYEAVQDLLCYYEPQTRSGRDFQRDCENLLKKARGE